jgi:hypothetical protein
MTIGFTDVSTGATYLMEHHPYGEPVMNGMRYHTLWRFNVDHTRELVAAVQCVIVTYRATPTLSWHVAAPERFSEHTTLVVSKRAFPNEGEAMDALLRLETLGIEGNLPTDIRDAI